ncbi:MAG: peptidoglycan-binding protein [Proteobacteria bacterium]|jgi:murein L,D-transpeptidase YcbB/YkuD|nr:peptidoglycan-binding protein [Candidatus Fonsibacter sp. PEL5]
MNEDLTKQNRYLKIYAVVLTIFTIFSAYFSFICYSQINLFYSYIENMDKRFIASSKKINNLIDENIKINQKVTDITEKTDKKINEIKTAAENKERLINDFSSPEKIKAFQAMQGLPQTGKIGPRTRKAILLLKR